MPQPVLNRTGFVAGNRYRATSPCGGAQAGQVAVSAFRALDETAVAVVFEQGLEAAS